MMNRWMMAAVTAAVLFFAAGPVSAGGTVNIATLDWEPYIGQSMEGQGYVAEVIREAFKRGGYETTFAFLPWARVVQETAAGKYDAYGPEYFAEEVKKYAVFSDPFPGGPLGFFRSADKDIQYQTLKDLSAYTIGVVKGYQNTKEFDAADFLKKDEAPDDLSNFKKLLRGRVDLVVSDKFVGFYTLKTNFPGEGKKVAFVEPPLENKDLFLAFSLKAPDHEAQLQAFNAGLKAIRADGTLDSILKKHGF